MQEIKRGEVWWANLGEGEGSEQAGRRPVLIFQNNVGNLHSPTVIVAAITDAKKQHIPTHVTLQPLGSLYKTSVVLLEQIRTIDKRRLDAKLVELSEKSMAEVDRRIKISLGLVELK